MLSKVKNRQCSGRGPGLGLEKAAGSLARQTTSKACRTVLKSQMRNRKV